MNAGGALDPRSRSDADADILAWLRDEASQPFAGWDFSYIDSRTSVDPLPWDYRALIQQRLPAVDALLDLGTGGGEFLALLAPLPEHTCATEGYTPNIPIARRRLEPLGVTVQEVDSDNRLRFADGEFDLVINRHESYDPAEVWRVLRSGGAYITQQVSGDNDADLNQLLDAPASAVVLDEPDWRLATARASLERAGFTIGQAEEAEPIMRFFDAGALVFHLTAIPWQIPDFSVDAYADQLISLQRQCRAGRFIESRNGRFLLIARKP